MTFKKAPKKCSLAFCLCTRVVSLKHVNTFLQQMLLSPMIQLMMNVCPQLHSRKCQVMLYKNIWERFYLNYLSGSNWINTSEVNILLLKIWATYCKLRFAPTTLMLMLVFALIISIIIIPIMMMITWRRKKSLDYICCRSVWRSVQRFHHVDCVVFT